jgi:hypothetical protein
MDRRARIQYFFADPQNKIKERTLLTRLAFLRSTQIWYHSVIPNLKAKPNAHSMCAQESSLHTYRTRYGYRNTNVIIYIIHYQIMSYKRLNRTLSEALQWKDTITPQAIDRWQSLA